MSWEVGLRALVPRRGLRAPVARPVTRGRVQALSRLTAPTHGRGFWLALSVAAVAAGFVALIPVIFDRGPPLPGYAVINRLSGVSFMACGLLAWRQRIAPQTEAVTRHETQPIGERAKNRAMLPFDIHQHVVLHTLLFQHSGQQQHRQCTHDECVR